MGGKSDAPAPPDYTSAAYATAQGNLEATKYAATANRPDMYTPYGQSIWKEYTPGHFTNTVTLAPQQQQLLDKQNGLSQQYADMAQAGTNAARSTLEHPEIDQSTLPSAPINAGQTAEDALMARLNPQIERDRQSLASSLANQGIDLGSQAYATAQNLQGQKENDARLQAALQGISAGEQARAQAIQEQSTFKNQPLNVLNALRTGSQVTNPTFQSFVPMQTVAGPNLLGAAQQNYQGALDQYNANNAAGNNFMSGLLGLGKLGVQAYGAGMFG